MIHTSVLTILRSARLSEDLEINKAEGHEAQREARHEAREQHQQHDDEYVNEELRCAACVLHRHSPLSLPLSLLKSLFE